MFDVGNNCRTFRKAHTLNGFTVQLAKVTWPSSGGGNEAIIADRGIVLLIQGNGHPNGVLTFRLKAG
jgi:hypothetical protein